MRAASLAFVIGLAAGPAWAERTFALVIGIDAYAHIRPLQGAVNDARDLAAAFQSIGADTVVLTDADATRAAIIDAWTTLAAQAGPGDRLIISYAGHGSNEVEAIPGEEEDGRDENWLLGGFSPFGPASGERIRDNEIAALIALSPDAEVILISDSCHSGTVTREIAPILGYRFFRTDGTLADDPLPPPPPRPAGESELGAVALYFGAVPDAEQVPEFLIDGQARGALSYAIAAGLRGAADADGDGLLTRGELESYVRASVRDTSRGLQRPQVSAAVTSESPLFTLISAGAEDVDVDAPQPDIAPGAGPIPDEVPETDAPPALVSGADTAPEVSGAGPLPDVAPGADPLPDLPPDTVQLPEVEPLPGADLPAEDPTHTGGGAFLLTFADLADVTLTQIGSGALIAPQGAQVVPAGSPADLVLDPATGDLRTSVGDLFTSIGNPDSPQGAAALQRAVDNARLAAALLRAGTGAGLDVRFAQGDGTYRDGDQVTVQVPGRLTPHLALFNIAPDGSIQPVYPLQAPDLGLDDPATLDPALTLDLTLLVTAPFGSDFLVAVETSAPSTALAALLADPLRPLSARDLWSALQAAEAEGTAPVVAIFPFHSAAE